MTPLQTTMNYRGPPKPAEPKPRIRLVRGPVKKTWAERFEEFHAQNPHIYREIVDEAFFLKAHHVKNIGMRSIFEKLRRDHRIRTRGDDFKFNNSFTAYYARLLIKDHPSFEGIVETRETK